MTQMPRFSKREEGSTLMLALVGLVFLTVVGLSLAVVTETEMLIGGNEQVSGETFYATEVGVSAAVTQLLVENNLDRRAFAIPARNGDDDRFLNDKVLGYSVDFSPIYPVHFSNAAYSTANVGGNSEMLSVFFKTSSRARRMAWDPGQSVPDCAGQLAGNGPVDEFADIQAETIIDYSFFVTPLTGIEIGSLEAGHRRVDQFGCEVERDDSEYGQTLPGSDDSGDDSGDGDGDP